jgi:Nucleotidyltransferase domain.
MATKARVDGFLFEFKRWAATEAGIHAVALIGSHARQTATEVSDVDLIVVVSSSKHLPEVQAVDRVVWQYRP